MKIDSNFKETIEAILLGFLLAIIITLFIKPIKVIGESMDYTLYDGQRLFVNRRAYDNKNPENKDIVVITTDAFGGKKKIIKRVIAVEGQSVKIENGLVYIDDKLLNEPYIKEPMNDLDNIYIEKIPKDNIFVMGDNRNNSTDSRHIGLIEEEDIYGKVLIKK